MTTLALIVAMDLKHGIGQSGALPWHLPGDLKFFKQATQNKVLLMGRKTFDSLPGVLPGRPHWVLSQSMQVHDDPQVKVFRSWEQMKDALGQAEAYVIGGGEFYRQALPDVTDLFVTRVDHEFACDVFFPKLDWSDWTLLSEVLHEKDAKHECSFRFQHFQRR